VRAAISGADWHSLTSVTMLARDAPSKTRMPSKAVWYVSHTRGQPFVTGPDVLSGLTGKTTGYKVEIEDGAHRRAKKAFVHQAIPGS
jgi:hypothetical protein